MAAESTGTLSSTGGGSEDALGSAATTDGTRVLALDLNDLVAGDIVQVYSKTKVLTGGTIRVGPLNEWLYGDDFVNRDDKIWHSDPVMNPFGAGFYIKQHVGTASIPWSVNTP